MEALRLSFLRGLFSDVSVMKLNVVFLLFFFFCFSVFSIGTGRLVRRAFRFGHLWSIFKVVGTHGSRLQDNKTQPDGDALAQEADTEDNDEQEGDEEPEDEAPQYMYDDTQAGD